MRFVENLIAHKKVFSEGFGVGFMSGAASALTFFILSMVFSTAIILPRSLGEFFMLILGISALFYFFSKPLEVADLDSLFFYFASKLSGFWAVGGALFFVGAQNYAGAIMIVGVGMCAGKFLRTAMGTEAS